MPEEGGPTRWTIPQCPGTKELMIDIAKADIKTPIDIQDALEIKEELYAALGTAAQSITMDKRGYSRAHYEFHCTTAHTVTVEYSYDNATWYQHEIIIMAFGVSKTVNSAARYWRLSSDAIGGSATVDLVLGSVIA